MYKYADYIDVVVAIENLITAYKMRGEYKIVTGLELALDRMKHYKDVDEILQKRDERYRAYILNQYPKGGV